MISADTDENRLPLTQHLAELRTRLVKAILAWIVASAIAWTWKEQIFAALLAPAVQALGGGKGHLQAIAPGDEITITDGAMKGLKTIVTRLVSGGDRVAVLLDWLGQEREAEVSLRAVMRPGDIRQEIRRR